MRKLYRHRLKSWPLGLAAILVAAAAVLWLAEPRVARLWLNTAALAAAASVIALPTGTLLAMILFKTDAPGRGPALMLLIGMLFIPLYLVTGAWDAGFGIQGWHTLVTNPHLAHEPWLAGWRAAIWVHGLAAVPWVVLIVGAGLRIIEAEVEEDAATCASPPSVLWHITLPRVAPAIGVAALWIGTVVLTEISVTDFFQVRTFAEEVYTQSALGTLEQLVGSGGPGAGDGSWRIPGAGLWSGLALSAVLAVAAILASMRLATNWNDATHRATWVWRLRAARWPVTAVLLSCLILLAGVPLANLAYKAGIQVTATDAGRVRAWSLWQLVTRVAAAPNQFGGELFLSGWLGAMSATAAVVLGLLLAWKLRDIVGRDSGPISILPLPLGEGWGEGKTSGQQGTLTLPSPKGKGFWIRLLRLRPTLMAMIALVAIALCLTIPGPLLGLAVIRVLNRPPGSPLSFLAWLYDSNFAPWLVQTIRTLPIATLILWPALASVPQVMLDSAATDGTGRWGQLLRIAVPQRWAALVAAWLIAFAVAIGELAATILVMPPQVGATALSIQIFQLLHYGVDDRVAAICLVMIAAIAVLTGIAARLVTNDR